MGPCGPDGCPTVTGAVYQPKPVEHPLRPPAAITLPPLLAPPAQGPEGNPPANPLTCTCGIH